MLRWWREAPRRLPGTWSCSVNSMNYLTTNRYLFLRMLFAGTVLLSLQTFKNKIWKHWHINTEKYWKSKTSPIVTVLRNCQISSAHIFSCPSWADSLPASHQPPSVSHGRYPTFLNLSKLFQTSPHMLLKYTVDLFFRLIKVMLYLKSESLLHKTDSSRRQDTLLQLLTLSNPVWSWVWGPKLSINKCVN